MQRLALLALLCAVLVGTTQAAPSVSSNSNAIVAPGATVLYVLGSEFDGSASVVLSATSGTITQPTAVTVASTTVLSVAIAALNDDLVGASIRAVVTTTAGSSGSASTIATVTTGSWRDVAGLVSTHDNVNRRFHRLFQRLDALWVTLLPV